MRRLVLIVLPLIVCCFVLVSTVKWEVRASLRTTWEHKIFVVPPPSTNDETEQRLTQLGADGWELVQVIRGDSGGGGLFYLKRAK